MDNSVDKQSSEKRFALLIDADNVSAKYIKPITDELSNYGTVTIKRIYGDWTLSLHAKWKDALLENSLTPIQQFGYTQGKNATDSAMIIDAMDILYANSVEGFCIVSSDSDFTRLASRLRESGRMVIGMGEKKTPVPFRRACDVFTTLELLLDDANGKRKGKDAAGSGPTIEEVEQAVVRIITDNQNNGKATGLGEVGSRLLKRFPDFDVRSYGTNLLSKLLGKFASVEIKKNGSDVAVELADDKEAKPKADEQAPEPEPAGDAAQDAPEAEERKSDEQAEGEGPKAEDGAGSSSSRRRKRRGGSRRKARAAADGETAASPEDGAEPAAEGEPAPDKKDGREPGAEGASATRTASGDDGTAPKPAEDGAASEPAVGGATPEPAEGQAASAPGGGQRPGAEEGAGPESSGTPAESTAAAESEAAKAPKTSKRRPRRKARAAEGAAEPMEPAVGTGNAEPKPKAKPESKADDAEPTPQAKPELKEGGAKPRPKAKSKAKAKAKPEPEPQAKPEPKPEPQAKSKPEASGAEQAKSNPEPGQSGRRPQTEQPAAARREADATTRRLVAQAGPDGIAVSQLASLVRSKHRGFKVRDLGYAQFKAYVADLDDIEVSRIGKEWFARMAD